jgi:hypothetical protein
MGLSEKWKALLFGLAGVAFAVEAVRERSLVAGGLALFDVPFFARAFDAADF